MSRYLLSADAQRDLEEIADYITLDKPLAARKFIFKLKARFQFLAANPNSGERFVGSDGSEYRRLSAWNYVIYFRVVERRVLISRVVHGKRNFTL